MKSCFAVSLSLYYYFFFKTFSTGLVPDYLFHDCPNTTLFTPNSTYQSNLDALLSSLSSAASNSTNGFANATAGQNPPDQVYGLFLCRGDLGAVMCRDCVATGKQEILERCPNQRVSVIWYNECMLRYTNEDIFSVMELQPNLILYNTGNVASNVTDVTLLMDLLGSTLNDIAARASTGGSGKKVAVAEGGLPSSQNLYTFAQCTPDLTASDCATCLRYAMGNLVQGKQGGRMLSPSCNVRYEFSPFYDASALPAPPPPAPASLPPAPMTGPTAFFFDVAHDCRNPSRRLISQSLPSVDAPPPRRRRRHPSSQRRNPSRRQICQSLPATPRRRTSRLSTPSSDTASSGISRFKVIISRSFSPLN